MAILGCGGPNDEKAKRHIDEGMFAQAIEYHQYAIANDPLLGRDLAYRYALQA